MSCWDSGFWTSAFHLPLEGGRFSEEKYWPALVLPVHPGYLDGARLTTAGALDLYASSVTYYETFFSGVSPGDDPREWEALFIERVLGAADQVGGDGGAG